MTENLVARLRGHTKDFNEDGWTGSLVISEIKEAADAIERLEREKENIFTNLTADAQRILAINNRLRAALETIERQMCGHSQPIIAICPVCIARKALQGAGTGGDTKG